MDGGSEPPELQTRNAEVFDSEGAVIAGTCFPSITLFMVLIPRSGFWQYGTLQWDEFYRYVTAFTLNTASWAIFQYDLTQKQHGARCLLIWSDSSHVRFTI